jgi:hypothetical protein
MELKNQLTRTLHPVVPLTMAMFREGIQPQQFAIPVAACPHIAHRNQWLSADTFTFRRGFHFSS